MVIVPLGRRGFVREDFGLQTLSVFCPHTGHTLPAIEPVSEVVVEVLGDLHVCKFLCPLVVYVRLANIIGAH